MSITIPDSLHGLKHFLSIRDLEAATLEALIAYADTAKQQFKQGRHKPAFQGKILAMLFQKSSLRTRLGFEAAMVQIGGHAINLEDHQVAVTKRESPRDVARVISSMCDVIMARVYAHQLVVELASESTVPVINGLSDWSHPCQALADLLTIKEHFGDVGGRKVAYVGDGNNVARSLMEACIKLGLHFAIAAPEGYQLSDGESQMAKSSAGRSGTSITTTNEAGEAVVDADVVYTDVWTSMGQEEERAERKRLFAPYQVNSALVRQAKPTAVVMHCLPAYRNLEITDDVIDGPQSIVFQQAENRLHTQRALLEVLLTQTR